MENFKSILIGVAICIVVIFAVIIWIVGLVRKAAAKKELKALQDKLEAERRAKVAAEKKAIDNKTPDQIMGELPEKEKEAIAAAVKDNTEAATTSIMSKLRARAIR